MAKARSAFAALFIGVVGVSACVIKTGPPPESQPAPAATAAPASTPAATTAEPAASATPVATTAGPNVAAPAVGAATSTPAPSATAAPTAADAGAYNPCAGKKCGDRCNLCPQYKPGCFETALVKMCHPDGQCKPATTVDCSSAK
jgi:hypothetical protein